MRYIFILILALAVSCKEKSVEPEICGVADPAKDLPWLKELIEFRKTDGGAEFAKYQYMMQAELDGNTVFYNGDCCPTCDTFVQHYDCAGNKITVDASKLVNRKVIWKPDNSVCTLN